MLDFSQKFSCFFFVFPIFRKYQRDSSCARHFAFIS